MKLVMITIMDNVFTAQASKNVSDKHALYTKIYITLKIAAQSWSHKSFSLPYNLTLIVSDLTRNIMSQSKL